MIDTKMRTETGVLIQSSFESFCDCPEVNNKSKNDTLPCSCGEEYNVYEWTWDKDHLTRSASLSENDREVRFHQTFSSGTAAVRGTTAFQQNRHYYWEIKMLTALYGTDVMVGVGTENVDMNLWPYRFCSLLGLDEQSWGYSYRGSVHHKGEEHNYGPRFGKGSIIGVHLDTCTGILEFYHNRRPLGIAFTGLKGTQLYPMVCSTAAQSAMRVTCAMSVPPNLQLLSILALRTDSSLTSSIDTVPGLRNLLSSRFWWLMFVGPKKKEKQVSLPSSPSPSGGSNCRRKRKRQHAADASQESDDDSENSNIPAPHNMIFIPCEKCGISRAVATKKSMHFRTNALCMYCDLLI